MFNEEADTSDRTFIALLIVAVLVVLFGIRLYANHLKAGQAARVTSIPQQPASSTIEKTASQEPARVLRLEAITHVYECERDGQRVLSDRPCGTGVQVRVIREPKKGVK